ncbi:hypothetical protein, partial [Vibrio tasmaniensis]
MYSIDVLYVLGKIELD